MSAGTDQLLFPDEYGVGSSGERCPERRSETLSVFTQLRLRLKSDEELMGCLQGGEANALTFLFQRHSTLVFHIAHRILRNHAEAEDTVQQVFLDIFRSSEQFNPEKGNFRTWLLMFAYHRTFNRRRNLVSRAFYTAEPVEDVLPELLAGAERAFSFSPAETAVLTGEALAMLQPRQRRTIELVYYEGLTAEEVAMRTGETVRVVRHNLYRGLEKLRKILCSPSLAGSGKKHDA
jgi:RNA polymerase sigma-70 factor (ECF subfamily)